MSDSPQPAARVSRWSWWNLLLVASLALNLLVGGAVAARFFFHPPIERLTGMTYLQLVPRRFFMDLDRDRRDQLTTVLKTYRDRFRDGQQKSRAVAASLADVLAAEPYDEAKVRAVVQAYADSGTGLLALGTEAVMDLIGRLTPAERASLAQRIRERGDGRR